MARTDTLEHFLTDLADAIREKTGDSGAITASSFDTAVANIPSGGSPQPTTVAEITPIVQDACNYFVDYLIENAPYTTSSSEEITVYSPDKNGFPRYIIYYNGNAKYQIVWFENQRTPAFNSYDYSGTTYNNLQFWYVDISKSIPNSGTPYVTYTAALTQNGGGRRYVSAEYNKLDDAINALKSPTTAYTLQASTTNALRCYLSNNTMIQSTNMPIWGMNISRPAYHPIKRISSNQIVENITT